MKDWEINFVEVKDGQITIEIISDHPENLKPTSFFLEYYEFESLMRCIDRLRQ